ncbi:MAG TPA: hypothetical protein VNN72_15490, partial [Polyangiaceae bacterium]|nr:hypothetical protein [Polyangiaceae bacterium]
ATGGASAGQAGSSAQGGSTSGNAGNPAGNAGTAASSGQAGGGRSGDGGTSGSSGSSEGGAPGAAGEPSNDPSCPMDMPTEGDDCPPGPRLSCTYDDTSCWCTTFWDCTGCPPGGPVHQAGCEGYEGQSCGGCDCADGPYPEWDCGPTPGI